MAAVSRYSPEDEDNWDDCDTEEQRQELTINHPRITTEELQTLLDGDPLKLPAELRARKIPLGLLLEQDNVSNDTIERLVQCLLSACQSGGDDARNIMKFMAKKGFLEVHVLYYIMTLRIHGSKEISPTLMRIVPLLYNFLFYASDKKESVRSVAVIIQDIIKSCPQTDAAAQRLLQEVIALDTLGSDTEHRSCPKSSCKTAIFPAVGEVVDCDVPSLELHDGDCSDVERYVDNQFQLLRQEIVEPLRMRISKYHQTKRCKSVDAALKDCRMFSGVYVESIITTHTSKGVTFRIHFFCTFPMYWESTKALAYGNLVCLTHNHFHDMIFAVVAKRDPAWLHEGYVDIRPLQPEDAQKLLSLRRFIMLDSQTYMEEIHEVLGSLKEIREKKTRMGFEEYIVRPPSTDHSPGCLLENPEMIHDLGALVKNETSNQYAKEPTWNAHVTNMDEWPDPQRLNVDIHQLKAIQAALTREVTVITGSPGTGKSSVCQKIVHLRLKNRLDVQQLQRHSPGGVKKTCTPVLYVCSTRASLDDFLVRAASFQSEGIVRSGGKTFCKQLAKHNLEEQRAKCKHDLSASDQMYGGELQTCRKLIDGILRNVMILDRGILSVDVLRAVISEHHYNGLQNNERGIMLDWLLGSHIAPRELQDIKKQVPWTKSRGSLGKADDDSDRWLERNMLLDFLPGQTQASLRVLWAIEQINNFQKMTPSDVQTVSDVWELPVTSRWALYRFWINEIHRKANERIARVYQVMVDIVLKSQRAHDDIDLGILQSASLIAMTTSAAVKARRVLNRLRTSLVILDEATDILQSISAAILPSDCQQLILIGDDRPKIMQYSTVKKLAGIKEIEISLIQRLIKSNYPQHRLAVQHRMSPTVSKISRLVSLVDDFEHDSTTTGPCKIGGITHNVYFIEHGEQMAPAKYESSFIWGLYCYLLQEGYGDQITVMTTFPAQYKLFKGKLTDQLQTVDNLRGDKDIVLFLSNGCDRDSRPGCVEIEQRLITLLTCARKALYIVGNFDFLTSRNDLWAKVIKEARRLGWVDKGIKFACPRHLNQPYTVSSLADFMYQSKTGCRFSCEARLKCGHTCKQPCHDHPSDLVVSCKALCGKPICNNGHRCKNLCFELCETKCQEPIEKELRCGHLQPILCHLSTDVAVCRDRCEQMLPCGHRCLNECGEPCTNHCSERVTKSKWQCGHVVEVKCSDGPESCPHACDVSLECGHRCSGTCGRCRGRLHVACDKPCGRILVCGHSCESSCSAQCPPCPKRCENRCQHSTCMNPCGDVCVPCRETCLWRCPHISCHKLCGEPCERKQCNEPCPKVLPCKHPCIGMCGEKCPTKCRICNKEEVTEIFFGSEDEETARFVQLEDCGHVLEVEGLDHWMAMEDESTTIQLQCCPRCKASIRKSVRYGTHTKRTLSDIERVKEKMRGSQTQIDANASELLEKIKLLHIQETAGNSATSKKDVQTFSLNVSRVSHLDKVVARVNRCNLLIAVNGLYEDANQQNKFHFILKARQSKLIDLLKVLKVFLCGGDLDRFSDQQISDVQQEINRANLQLEALTALNSNIPWTESNMTAKQSALTEFTTLVSKESRFTEEDGEQAGAFMQRIKESCGGATLWIRNKERVDIVKAMGLSKGSWYKCPNGHVYAIGEYGGAMEKGRCPECGANVGGQSHR